MGSGRQTKTPVCFYLKTQRKTRRSDHTVRMIGTAGLVYAPDPGAEGQSSRYQ
jgi:hypothetical protein